MNEPVWPGLVTDGLEHSTLIQSPRAGLIQTLRARIWATVVRPKRPLLSYLEPYFPCQACGRLRFGCYGQIGLCVFASSRILIIITESIGFTASHLFVHTLYKHTHLYYTSNIIGTLLCCPHKVLSERMVGSIFLLLRGPYNSVWHTCGARSLGMQLSLTCFREYSSSMDSWARASMIYCSRRTRNGERRTRTISRRSDDTGMV